MSFSASRFLPGLALVTALVAACAQGELKGGGGGGDECDKRSDCDAGESCQDGECVPDGGGQGGQGGGNPYGYDGCCEASSEPGCGSPNIELCVCAFDDYCCTSAWDVDCVSAAVACGACTTGPSGPASTGVGVGPTSSSVGVGPASSGVGPSSTSVGPSVASSSSSGGGSQDCCTTSSFPGCIDPAIEACVCASDSFCCNDSWDATCVSGATACGGGCGGAISACCQTSASPGCPGDPAVQACVCALDPYCCNNMWDSACVNEAQTDCGATCI